MEITIEKLKNIDKGYHDDFTIFIEDHRILTIYAYCDVTVSKWLRSVRKSYLNKKRRHLIVGVCTGGEKYYKKAGYKDNPFEQISLCVGSHCLIYDLPNFHYGRCGIPDAMVEFFSDPNIFFVGMDMQTIARKIAKELYVKIARPVDLRSLAEKGLDLWKGYLNDESLDMVVNRVFGRQMDVVRPENKIEFWTQKRRWPYVINQEYTKYSTVDAFLAREVGMQYFDIVIRDFT